MKRVIKSTEINKGNRVDAFVHGNLVSPFLHYTAFKNQFTNILLLTSHEPVEYYLNTKYYDPAKSYSITPGSIAYYDMDDLISLLPESSVKVIKTQADEKTEEEE